MFAQRIDSIYVTTKNDVNIHCLIGFMGSGDYATALESMGATGYLHWLAIDFGVGLRAQDNIYLAPRLHWLVSRMKYESSGYSYNSYENSKFTSVLIPGLTGRYYFKNIGALYALASIGIIASVSSDFLDGEFTGNGIELECGLGYEFPIGSRCFVVELGYSRVPIKYSYQGYYQAAENSLRWGGMFLNIGTSFNITDY
ncbi:MAG: hypothetical protein EHM64_13700 [Ignavibacteriae bacterium]|nr:MAG: hypothetical protein EHM64_13700 [Ignavibacteriota bacterium]